MSKKYDHVIIAGSEKCGTTSLYQYLVDSGYFNPSIVKETDFFRKNEVVLEDYYKEFQHNAHPTLEASPGYLTESDISSSNMASTLPVGSYLLLFCLRDPVKRLVSSFLFHKSRLYLDQDMGFSDYVDLCLAYEAGEYNPKSSVEEWCLGALKAGKFYERLWPFLKSVDHNDFLVFTADYLAKSPEMVVFDVFKKLNVDLPEFYESYGFDRSNVTSGFKNSTLQKFGLIINSRFEWFWLRYPKAKKYLLKIYLAVNGKDKEEVVLSAELKNKLRMYYQNDMESLCSSGLISLVEYEKWSCG